MSARLAQERRSDGERPLTRLDGFDRVLLALRAKYGRRVQEYGSREHATGHVSGRGHRAAEMPGVADWVVK